MKRKLLDNLYAWNEAKNKMKPLILMGARQVGKSWLMKEFAQNAYGNDTVYVDLRDNDQLREAIANTSVDAFGIVELVSTATGKRIIPGKTLLILDEIQESPKALSSLKYFHEKIPDLAVMAAGSLLGIALNRNENGKNANDARVSFPVGKVNFLDVPPMTFTEFLDAIGENEKSQRIEECAWTTVSAFHSNYCELLKKYYITGGMPEAVLAYSQDRDFVLVRSIQKEILKAYDLDFAKHARGTLLAKIRLLWNAIPAQLAKENKKLIYTALRSGARARDYEVALQWLEDAGMIHQVHRVSRPGMPLKAYEEFSAFKLYAHDIGLLCAMADLPQQIILDGNELFSHFKGAFTEQYVLQELNANGMVPYYWSTDEGMSEIEFVLQGEHGTYPLEVKAETNLQAKSLAVYRKKFNPEKCLRASMTKYKAGETIEDWPLYSIGQVKTAMH